MTEPDPAKTQRPVMLDRLLGGYERRRALFRLLILLLVLALSVIMLLSIGQTGRISEEARAINSLLRATDDLQIKYGRTTDAIATFMFLGSDETWDTAQAEVAALEDSAAALSALARSHAPEEIAAAEAITDNVRVYRARLAPLKEIRQDPRGVVAGVRASNIVQASHNYGFISRLAEAIAAVATEATGLEEYTLLDRLRDVHGLWLRLIMEFRAHLMLRSPASLMSMNVYIGAFRGKWQALMADWTQLPLGVQAALREADTHQQQWLSALPQVLEVHGSKRWREDLRYVDDSLRPVSADLLTQLDRFVVTLSQHQKQAQESVLTNERAGFLWAALAMGLGTVLTIALLFILNRMLRQQEQQRSAAEAASRMKTEFLSRMSHELRTPMNAILGFAQLLESDPEEPLSPKQQEQVGEILHGGYHLLELINEVLDLTAIESGKARLVMGEVPLSDILDESLSLVRPLAARHGVTIIDRIRHEPERCVHADRTRIKQVLLNLMSNAIKYNRQGGTVSLTCSERGNALLRIAIADTGFGIRSEDQQRLFQPFERLHTSDTVEGTGIGLAVTRQLIESMDGRIGVVSKPGEGSTFWIEIRTVTRQPIVPSASHSLPAHTARRGNSVLCIDDDVTSQTRIRQLLAQWEDVRLLETSIAEEGLHLAALEQPDLILLNLNLPHLSGVEVLERLQTQQRMRCIPVVALSSDPASHVQIQRAIAAGFDDYLAKPIDSGEFFTVLKRYLPAVDHPAPPAAVSAGGHSS